MSLLDDLKQQAEDIRQPDVSQEKAVQRDLYYRQHIRPRMQEIHNYLSELVETLEVVDPDIFTSYSFVGFGHIENMRQGGYVVNADSKDQTKMIRLRFHAVSGDEADYPIRPKSLAGQARDFLESHKMRYTEWTLRDEKKKVTGINFQFTPKVDINFIFQADILQGGITLLISNFQGFKVDKNLIKPERVDAQWLDDLGNFLLRKRESLFTLEIDEKERAQIRKRLAESKRERQLELEEALKREEVEHGAEQRNRLTEKLRALDGDKRGILLSKLQSVKDNLKNRFSS